MFVICYTSCNKLSAGPPQFKKRRKYQSSSIMSKQIKASKSEFVSSCKVLLREVFYPHIEIIPEENLVEMLFKPGTARLEVLKWIFTQIDAERTFSDSKLGEELMEFAVENGLCKVTEKQSLVLGTPEAALKRQADWWRLLLESVRDIRKYRGQMHKTTPRNQADFLENIIKSSVLEDLVQSAAKINICPALLNVKKVAKLSPDKCLKQQRDKLCVTLDTLQAEVNDLNTPQVSASERPEQLLQEITALTRELENEETLDKMASTLPCTQQQCGEDLELKQNLDNAAIKCKNLVKMIGDRDMLNALQQPENLMTTFTDDVPLPEMINVLNNNFNSSRNISKP